MSSCSFLEFLALDLQTWHTLTAYSADLQLKVEALCWRPACRIASWTDDSCHRQPFQPLVGNCLHGFARVIPALASTQLFNVLNPPTPPSRTSGGTGHAKSVHRASRRRPLAGQVQVFVPQRFWRDRISSRKRIRWELFFAWDFCSPDCVKSKDPTRSLFLRLFARSLRWIHFSNSSLRASRHLLLERLQGAGSGLTAHVPASWLPTFSSSFSPYETRK